MDVLILIVLILLAIYAWVLFASVITGHYFGTLQSMISRIFKHIPQPLRTIIVCYIHFSFVIYLFIACLFQVNYDRNMLEFYGLEQPYYIWFLTAFQLVFVVLLPGIVYNIGCYSVRNRDENTKRLTSWLYFIFVCMFWVGAPVIVLYVAMGVSPRNEFFVYTGISIVILYAILLVFWLVVQFGIMISNWVQNFLLVLKKKINYSKKTQRIIISSYIIYTLISIYVCIPWSYIDVSFKADEYFSFPWFLLYIFISNVIFWLPVILINWIQGAEK